MIINFVDVIGLVVYVSKYMYKKLDVAIMNNRYGFVLIVFLFDFFLIMCSYFVHVYRREIIFVRVWDRQVGRHITRWRPAENGLWTLAATMLEVKRAEGNMSVKL